MNSIFVRLSRWTIATVLVAYALVGAAIYVGIVRYLEARVDEALITKASVIFLITKSWVMVALTGNDSIS